MGNKVTITMSSEVPNQEGSDASWTVDSGDYEKALVYTKEVYAGISNVIDKAGTIFTFYDLGGFDDTTAFAKLLEFKAHIQAFDPSP